MHHSGKAHRGILLALLACVCGWRPGPALAQPDTNTPGQLMAISADWQALRHRMEGLEIDDPQEAINTYNTFYDREGYRSGEVAIDLSSRIAQLYWRQLNDPAKAGQIYDWAIRQYGTMPGGERLIKERGLLTGDKVVAVPTVKAAPGAGGAGVAPVDSGSGGGPRPGVGAVPARPGGGDTVPAPPTAPVLLALPAVPMPIAAAPTATVPVVATARVAQTLVLAELRAGAVDPEQAWKQGDLTADAVLEWINEHALRWPEDATLANALLDQVARHAPEGLTSTALKAQPVETRVRIGDYFSSQHDERAVALYQEVMAEPGAKPGTLPDWYGPAGARLGAFFADNGQPQKAVQEYLQVAKALPPGDQYAANVVIDAARLYAQMGDTASAQALYAQVSSYGNGWVTGIALFDQASKLIGLGQHEEARKLLQQPLTGTRSEQATVAILSLLAYSYYLTGEFEFSRHYAEQAIAQYKSLQSPPKGEGLEGQVGRAHDVLSWIEKWKKKPIVIEPYEPRTIVSSELRQEQESTVARVFVRTFRPVALTVRSDYPGIKASLTTESRDTQYFSQNEVLVKVVPNALRQSVDTELIISSPRFPDFQARVPLHVEVQSLIQLSSPTVFFGSVKAGMAATRMLSLSAPMPFRIVEVMPDDPALAAKVRTMEASQEQQVELKFSPLQARQIYSGTIRLKTDVPAQEVVEVPYIARAD